ncbi:MAG: hypothetical protein Q8M36_08135 [Reyranella sp.]|nr:hypothetical protein [Reyranella sp.]MDP2373596.1 hypothetical protein [Reyranella sp.]
MRPCPALRRRLSGKALRAAAQPDRSLHRCAGGRCRRSGFATAGLLSNRTGGRSKARCNADTDGALLAAIVELDAEGRALLTRAAERLDLSARAWHRTLRVASTLAHPEGSDSVRHLHIAEVLSYGRPQPRGDGGVMPEATSKLGRHIPRQCPKVVLTLSAYSNADLDG